MMKEKKLVPELRFSEFEDEWKKIRLGDFIQIKSGNSPSSFDFIEEGKYPFIKVEELNNCDKYQFNSRFYSNSTKNLVAKNSILFPKRGAAILNNKIRISSIPLLMDSNMMALECDNSKLNFEFLYYKILKEKLYKIADTSTIPQLNNKHIQPYKLYVSSLQEQQKIANFLSSIDNQIQSLEKKKTLLEHYKKGVIQKIFKQELMFKDDNGDSFPEWNFKKGNLLFETISNKNHNSDLPILAISQEFGAIPRELINYNISVTQKSVDSYKVVEKGDFIISLRSFQGGIEYSEYTGICSPAYIILRSKVEIADQFYKSYFKSNYYIKQLCSKLEGIRDGKMISYKYFSEIKLPNPSLKEQLKIANFLSTVDKNIDIVNQKIAHTKTYKKGLLQQMFV